MSGARLIITAAVIAAGVLSVIALNSGGAPRPVEIVPPSGSGIDPARLKSAEGCGSCHDAVYREWRDSWHAKAMTDPYFVEKLTETSDGSENPACLPCHVPLPIHETGIGMRPRTRNDRRVDGIDCLTCHKSGGGVAGPSADATGPCNPIHVPDPTGTRSCAGCHNQHWTVDEWEASIYSREGTRQTCMDCHMPEVIRTTTGRGRNHTMHGGRELSELVKAVTFSASVDGRDVVVGTTNSGAGHKIPTDSRHRSFNVMIWFRDESGNLVSGPTELGEYRLYYRQDLREVESTQIAPQATATERAPIPDGLDRGQAVVRLYFCLTPIIAGKLRVDGEAPEALLVAERTVAIGK